MSKLLVVATPIGNLDDLTPRIREALQSADLIAAEDTRVTMKLLHRFEIKRPLVSLHRHNEEGRAPQLIARMLAENLTVALTCDAGTPAISDPGHLLVRAAWEAGIPVSPICGPSAVTAALSASGFDAREFAFYGFPPREKKALTAFFQRVRKTEIPVNVFFESPHRVEALVERMAECWPESTIAVFSDLSKRYEWLLRGTPIEVLADLKANPNSEKGEYCVVADLCALPPIEDEEANISAVAFMAQRMFEGAALQEAEMAAADKGFPRNQIYRAKLFLRRLEA